MTWLCSSSFWLASGSFSTSISWKAVVLIVVVVVVDVIVVVVVVVDFVVVRSEVEELAGFVGCSSRS